MNIGTKVYVGYSPLVMPTAKSHLCSVGVIIAGPFPPYHVFPVGAMCPEISWIVETDAGRAAVVQSLLTPFQDPDAAVDSERRADETVLQ